jgi:mgtE-like transporter
MIYNWKIIVKNGVPLLTVAVVIEIFAGQILQGNQNSLFLFPIFLITIPVINGVSGNIGSILGARLASGLHVGYIELNLKDKNIQNNFFTSLIIGLITYTILGIIIYVIAYFGNVPLQIDLFIFLFIVLITGGLLILLISIISVLTAFLAFKKGLDPDDMVAPVVTTLADTLGIIILFMLIGALGIW